MGDLAPDETARSAAADHVAQTSRDTSGLLDSAPRRTYLAGERTFLAWLRTGLGAIAVALAVGHLLPALVSGSRLEYGLLGMGYGVLGMFLIAYGLLRSMRVQAALESNRSLPLYSWGAVLVTVMGLVLAAATILMVMSTI